MGRYAAIGVAVATGIAAMPKETVADGAKVCPACFRLLESNLRKCRGCGYVIPQYPPENDYQGINRPTHPRWKLNVETGCQECVVYGLHVSKGTLRSELCIPESELRLYDGYSSDQLKRKMANMAADKLRAEGCRYIWLPNT